MVPQFLELFSHSTPALRVKFSESDKESKTIPVQHKLGGPADAESCDYLDSLPHLTALTPFREFYQEHNGAELCCAHHSRLNQYRPLIELKPAKGIGAFTNKYLSGGDWHWVIELNKSKTLYRGAPSWIAFAEVGTGPACLTMFLNGENAGCVFFVTPQPRFNILRPVAKSFPALLERMAKDLPAFLRLVRADVCLRGADGENYGFSPFEYVPHSEIASRTT